LELLEALLALGERPWPVDRVAAAVRNGRRPVSAANGQTPHNGHPRAAMAPNADPGANGNGNRGNGSRNGHMNGNGNGYRPHDGAAPAGRPATTPSEQVVSGSESG
jgi:hypothetical protein